MSLRIGLPRSYEPELLDGDGHDPVELAESLDQVAQVNALLGGHRSLRPWIAGLAREVGPELDLLDVGTGNGRTLRELGAWAAGRGIRVRAVGVDASRDAARLARAGGSAVVRADGLRLPWPDDTFDAAFCCLTLHHFDDEAAVGLVREMGRVARRLVLVSDLERSRFHWWGARLLAATVWRGNRLTRTDGPHSVRRSFTADELAAVGGAAGLRDVRVERYLPWRLLLAGQP